MDVACVVSISIMALISFKSASDEVTAFRYFVNVNTYAISCRPVPRFVPALPGNAFSLSWFTSCTYNRRLIILAEFNLRYLQTIPFPWVVPLVNKVVKPPRNPVR